MDIPELSMAMSLSNVQSQWSIGMMSKAMDQAEVMSDSLIKMMESRGVVGPTQDNTNWHTVLIPTENEAGEIFDGLADERLQSLETLKRHSHPEWRRKIQVCVDSIKYTIAEQNSQIARLKREHEGLLSKLKEIEQALDEYDAKLVPSNETKENC